MEEVTLELGMEEGETDPRQVGRRQPKKRQPLSHAKPPRPAGLHPSHCPNTACIPRVTMVVRYLFFLNDCTTSSLHGLRRLILVLLRLHGVYWPGRVMDRGCA